MFNEEKIIAKWAADMYDANETDTADVDFALSIVGDAPKRILEVACGSGRILVPRYDFVHQCRDLEPSASLRLKKNEVAVFEGIHALNDSITLVHPEAFKLYISARSNVEFNGQVVFLSLIHI